MADKTPKHESKTAEGKRHRKTARQRAEEAYGRADRAVTKFEAKVKDLTNELEEAKVTLRDLEARRAYLAADPALPQPDELPDFLEAPAGGPIMKAPDEPLHGN